MKSPFPGMDPYLEDRAFWEDFHRRFITQIADAMLERLPDSYDAHIDERVRLVQADFAPSATRLPDVVVDWRGRESTHFGPIANAGSAVATLEPISIPMPSLEEHRDVWIEIVHLPERNLVTAIEVLSPSNKAGDDAADYYNKRIEFYTRHVNLVEIDLLRGPTLPLASALPPGDYYTFVATDRRRPYADVYHWFLRDALPTIPVPLKLPDADIPLNLAEIFSVSYDRGRCGRRLRYEMPLNPPLESGDQDWAEDMLARRE